MSSPIVGLPAGAALTPVQGMPAGAVATPLSGSGIDTSNPQGQGTYNMWDQHGQMHAVPYSLVQHAAQKGYKFDTNPIHDPSNPDRNGLTPSQAFQRDYNNATTGPGHEAAYAQSDQSAPLPMQSISGVVKGIGTIGKPVMDVVGAAGGVPQESIDQSFKAQTPMETAGKGAMIAAALAPAAIASPVATATGIVGGTAAATGAGAVANSMGANPRTAALVSDAAGLAGGVAGGYAGSRLPSVGSAMESLYPTSKSLPTEAVNARNLSKALVVDPAGSPNFIRAATDEAGTVVDFAQKNNLPINSKVDFANAAKATADRVQSYYNDKILGPNANRIASIPADYRGMTTGEGPNATLGSINDRINAINQELNPNFRKGLASQTSAANVSDADLLAEKQALTSRLHKSLADATGLQPDDIAGIRQQAGKLRTIADEANLSANRDTAASGKNAMGATTSAVGTKTGIIDRTLQGIQGGPEVIGNRQILSALKNVTPKPLTLPDVAPPAVPVPARPGMAQAAGITPTQPPSNVIEVSPYAQLSAMNSRLTARGAAVQDARTAEEIGAQQRTSRLQELMQMARNIQTTAAASRAKNASR